MMMMKILSGGQEISFVRSFHEKRNQPVFHPSKQASNGRLFKHVFDSIRVALTYQGRCSGSAFEKKRRTTEDCLRKDSFSSSKQQLLRPPVAQRINLDERDSYSSLHACARKKRGTTIMVRQPETQRKCQFPSSSLSYSFRRPRLP